MGYLAAFVIAALFSLVFIVRPLRAQLIYTPPVNRELCTDKVAVVGLSIAPAQPAPGQTAAATFTFKNNCSSGAALNIPWQIWKDGVVIATGTASSVAPGQAVTVEARWLAKVGTHNFKAETDPANTLVEGLAALGNNVTATVSVTINVDWNGVREKTMTAFRTALSSWNENARLKDVDVNGPAATGGKISAPDLYLGMRAAMTGVPDEVATPLTRAICDQWNKWSGSAKVSGLPWYPPFAAVPSPVAPPTPNVPVPLAALQQDVSLLSPSTLTNVMNYKLGSLASLPGAPSAIVAIANNVSVCFVAFNQAIVANVMGTGPVPTFAPPYVPIGPVVGGKANQTTPLTSPSICP